MSETDANEVTTEPAEQESTAINEEATERTFTQDDVDRIVSERLTRVENKYHDYNTLKKQVDEFETALSAARTEAVNEVKAEFIKEKALNAIALEAKGRFADTEDALLNLNPRVGDFITDGEVSNEAVVAAIDALLEAKPHLGIKALSTPTPHDVGLGHTGGSKPPASNAQKFAEFFNESLAQ